MIRYIFVVASAVVIAGLTLLVSILPNQSAQPVKTQTTSTSNSFLLTNVDVFDGENLISNTKVRVTKGEVAAVAENLTAKENEIVISGNNMTLLPGLIDSHTHSFGNGLVDTLRFGVTTHLDMFTMESGLLDTKQARQSITNQHQADLFSAGTMATVAGGHGTQYGFSIDTIDSIKQIPSWVKRRKDAGADYIKLVYMPDQNYMPSLTLAQATEVIHQAHKQNMLALAHISTQAAAQDMIDADIDGLVHIFADRVADQTLINSAKQKGIFVIPTLAVIASVDNQGLNLALAESALVKPRLTAAQRGTLTQQFGSNISGFDLSIAQQNVGLLHAAGVPILVGSDAPNSGTAYGVSTHHEMQLMIESGMTEQNTLAAATSLPATIFNLSERGRIKPEHRADFLLVSGQPTDDISATLNIEKVFKNGFEVVFEQARDRQAEKITTATLGNFDGTEPFATIAEFKWDPSHDQVANGNSTAEISLITPGAEQTRGALYVEGSVKSGFPYPWAGAAIGDFSPPVQGVDVSDFSKIVFYINGRPGTYRLLSFDANSAGIPPAQTFIVTEQWQRIELSLDQFSGFDPKIFSGFAFVAGPQIGDFEFSLDQVHFE